MFHIKGLHLLKLKIKNLVSLFLGDLFRWPGSLFDKSIKSIAGMISHYTLVFLTKKESFQFSPLVNIQLKATQVESTSEGQNFL